MSYVSSCSGQFDYTMQVRGRAAPVSAPASAQMVYQPSKFQEQDMSKYFIFKKSSGVDATHLDFNGFLASRYLDSTKTCF